MQLTLLDYLPELEKSVYLDVFAQKKVDKRTNRPTLSVIDGQPVPSNYKIRCKKEVFEMYPDGTIFKLDVRLVHNKDKKPYMTARKESGLNRAIEFFDYNLRLQNSK